MLIKVEEGLREAIERQEIEELIVRYTREAVSSPSTLTGRHSANGFVGG